jgi:two-component system, NtrC family, sensor kinase
LDPAGIRGSVETMNALSGGSQRAPLRPLLIAVAAAALLAFTAWLALAFGAAAWTGLVRVAGVPGWQLALAMGACAALVLAFLAGRRDLLVLHRAIRKGLEGDLAPASSARPPRDGTAIADYNVLARRLGSLFEEMERTQLSIIEERNRIDAVLRGLPCVMLAVDDELCVTASNGRAEELFGHGGDGLRGRNLFDLLELDEEGREILREAFLYEQQVGNRPLVLGEGESRRHFTLSVTFFKSSPRAKDPCAVIMLQDVTDYRRLQEIAHQSEKFVAIGQLAGGVAHELNTPLGTIVGYCQLLNAGGVAEAKRAQYTQAIYGEAKRCAGIIDNLLAYARREPYAPESCDLNIVIRDLVETLCACRRNRYEVPIDLHLGDALPVLGGAFQLDIVLVNIITNALQAASAAAAHPRVLVASRMEGAHAIVTVTDNGPGVAEEVRHRVFDPFFSTKAGEGGTGLGLAISHSIVTSIGGSLYCDATFRAGARFVLKLPLAPEGTHGDRARA